MNVLGLIGIFVSVTLGVGSALALVRGSYNKARMEAIRQDNNDLRSRTDDQDKELARCKAREDVHEAKIVHLQSENTMLTAMITQRANVDIVIASQAEVLAELKAHNAAAEAHWDEMIEEIKKIGRDNA